MVTCILCMCSTVRLKSRIQLLEPGRPQHDRLHSVRYRPAVFFRPLRLYALLFLQGKKWVLVLKVLLFNTETKSIKISYLNWFLIFRNFKLRELEECPLPAVVILRLSWVSSSSPVLTRNSCSASIFFRHSNCRGIVRIVLGLRGDRSGARFLLEAECFYGLQNVQTGSTLLWDLSGGIFPGGKTVGAGLITLSRPQLKNDGSCTSTTPVCLHGVTGTTSSFVTYVDKITLSCFLSVSL
jgi:hypothetical protein